MDRCSRPLVIGHRLAGVILAAVFLLAWWYPVEKPNVALARFTYRELMLALLGSALLASILAIQVSSRDRFRKSAFRLAALWLGGGTTLLAMELAAIWMPPVNNPFYLYNTGDIDRQGMPDRRLPFVRTAGIRWEGWSYGNIGDWQPEPSDRRWITFKTDYQGFRNSQDLKRADLVFIGDSFTEAGNVLEEESFVSLAAAELGVTARNLGMCGLCPPEQVVVLEHFGLPCQPDVVVWQIYEGNDLPESWRYAEWEAKGYPPKEPQGTSRWEQWSVTHVLYRQLVWHERDWLAGDFRTADGGRLNMRFHFSEPENMVPFLYDEWGSVKSVHPGWTRVVAALRSGHRLVTEQGRQLIVLFIPTKNHVMNQSVVLDSFSRDKVASLWPIKQKLLLARHVSTLCEELSVPFIDATDRLVEHANAGEAVFLSSDTHTSPRGNEVIRDLIVEAIQSATAVEESSEH